MFAPHRAIGRPRHCPRGVPRRAIVLLTLLVSLVVVAGAGAAYPSPPPDFSHPGINHTGFPFAQLYNRTGGQEDRPLLVIYVRWDDVDYPAGFDAQTVARRYFGTGFPSTEFPSVGDYLRRLSFNDLFVFPAYETEGTLADGVVQVQVPTTKAAFFALSPEARNKRLLELADQYVDYASFDGDGNGSLSGLELGVNAYEAAPETPMWQGLGIASGVASVTLDGTALGGLGVAMTNTSTNLLTIVHENAHMLAGMPDLYGFGVGRLDLGGPTGGGADTKYFAPSAYQKMHWGWITPTVVTKDGFYEVRRADTTGDAFILYDPDRGTDDYFMVENRTMTPGSYDQNASDRGLVVWRINDSSLGVATGLRPIELMLPDGTRTPAAPTNYAGSPRDAWNPADPSTPQRTMSRPWADGTAARVAVRAIGPAGDVVRAYFDVVGPGVLVDTYELDRAAPVPVTAGGSNVIDVPITNTGEEGCDTFRVDAVQLPAGWTMSSGARILCAGETSLARLTVTPDANAAVGTQTIGIQASSTTAPGVTSVSPLRVDVVLRPTTLDLGGLSVTPTGATTTFQASLTADGDPSASLGGVAVTFTLSGAAGTLTLSATTDANGVATATTFVSLPPGTYTLTVASERLGAFAPASTTVTYEVLSPEGAIENVVVRIDELIAGTTSSGVRSALQAARSELVGNRDGTPTNGAVDKLEEGAPAAAITKLRAAISDLLTAEAQGGGDLSLLEDLLGRTAEAIATAEYEKAKAAVGTTPSPGEERALARISALILEGRAELESGAYLDACESFRQATARAVELSS